jgi:hypothetical protein
MTIISIRPPGRSRPEQSHLVAGLEDQGIIHFQARTRDFPLPQSKETGSEPTQCVTRGSLPVGKAASL